MILTDIIKEDWGYNLPDKIKNNRYFGISRFYYQILCILYYSAKTSILLPAVIVYYFFYGLCAVLKAVFRRDSHSGEEDEAQEDD